MTGTLLESQEAFRAELVGAGLLVRAGVDGLYGRSGTFEDVIDALDRVVRRAGADQESTRLRFPPVLPTDVFEKTGYLGSFPNLIGSVHTFTGDDRAHAALLAAKEAGEDWTALLAPSGVVLQPAACHPLYPQLTGALPDGGVRYDIYGFCFRHEPSVDPSRMQAFRQYEFVYVGDADTAAAHREHWVERGMAVLESLQLDASPQVANDPFFGRAGRMLAVNQRDETLKIELVVRMHGDLDDGTAVVSCNRHLDHFGVDFAITTPDGAPAHSACVGFGMERIVLALLRTHGMDPLAWPAGVRATLWP